MSGDVQAYLIRFSRTKDNGSWRVRLQNAYDNEVHHFPSEKDLFLFLKDRLALNYIIDPQHDAQLPTSPEG